MVLRRYLARIGSVFAVSLLTAHADTPHGTLGYHEGIRHNAGRKTVSLLARFAAGCDSHLAGTDLWSRRIDVRELCAPTALRNCACQVISALNQQSKPQCAYGWLGTRIERSLCLIDRGSYWLHVRSTRTIHRCDEGGLWAFSTCTRPERTSKI